jgi:signal transduction histidine kinase
MFIPLVVLRFTLLRNPPRPRPWIALGGFFLAAIVRGIVLTSLLLWIGAVEEPLWAYRMTASIVNVVVILTIVALVVGTFRAHKRSLDALIDSKLQLEATQERILSAVNERSEDAVQQVQERLRKEIARLESVDGVDSVSELQRLAGDVVRPMSHELANSIPILDAPPAAVTASNVTWQQIVSQMVDRPPLRAVAAAALIGLYMFIAAAGVFGSQGIPLAVTLILSILILSFLGNLLLSRVLPQVTARTAVIIFFITALVIGFLSIAFASSFFPPDVNRFVLLVGGGIFVAGIVVLMAVVGAILRQQRDSEQELVLVTQQLRRNLVRSRQIDWLQRKALSQAIHGPVQSAVTSAALRLDAAVRSKEPIDTLIMQIRHDLKEVIDVLDPGDVSTPSFDEALQRIAGTWDGVCAVTCAFSPSIRLVLERDSIARVTVIDLLTEAVSNAVRHGGATHVHLDATLGHDGQITLRIQDDGRSLSETPALRGLGTVLLEECTLEWNRTLTPAGCVLTIVLPTDDRERVSAVPA